MKLTSILAEHAGEEDYVTKRGYPYARLLGGLMPSRCFGDHDYNLLEEDFCQDRV
jgi:hypothetical protein